MARVSFVEQVVRVGAALAWILLFAAVGLGVTIALSWLVPGVGGQAWWLARNGLYQLVGFLVATWVVGRRLNRYDWDRMGWRPPPPGSWSGQWLKGAGLGAGMAAVAIALSVVAVGAAVQLTPNRAAFLPVAGPLAVGVLAAALSEELMFRGYPLRRLSDGVGPVTAVALLAVGFGAAHLGNPSVAAFGAVNIALAAVWLSVAFFAGGLALAWGLHFGWNATLGLVFDAPVSGWTFDVPGVDYLPGRHAWLDGGSFGPEGGLVGTLVFLAGTLLIAGTRLRRPVERPA